MDLHVLNTEQITVMDLAMSGHNVFVGGKPGTGKTYTVKHLAKSLNQIKHVEVTCTTGMACSLYEEAMTIHSFAGIKDSRLNVDSLVTSILSRESCKQRWIQTDSLIIDEVSQLSAKNFEVLNTLAQRVRGSVELFGGLQLICVGDFFQLPPIQSSVDNGKYCFESPLWEHCFGHTVVLQKVYRQDPKEKQFLGLLDDFAMGECSDDSLIYLNTHLSNKRLNCGHFGMSFVPHIFCNNFDATFFNMNKLNTLPGESKLYISVDTCEEQTLNKVTMAEKKLYLKVGAEVMLLYNISSKLTNGTRGRVLKLEDDGPTVEFYQVGVTMKLSRVSWFAYKPDTTNHIVGQRSQFPLKLAWGITAHKSQGQTLQAAYIHSGKEFAAGQLYVAVSRVSSQEGVSILGFNPKSLIKADERVVNFYQTIQFIPPSNDFQCCRKNVIDTPSSWNDLQYLEDPQEDGCFTEDDLTRIDAICASYYDEEEGSGANVPVNNLEEILKETLLTNKEISLPEDLCVYSFLENLKDSSLQSSVDGSLGMKINDLITHIQQPDYLPKVKSFIDIQWVRVAKTISENIKKKKDGSVTYDFKAILAAEMNYLNADHLASEFSAILQHKDLRVEHHCLITELVKAVREEIISRIYLEGCLNDVDEQEEKKNVWDMSDEGKSKVRYIGGWAIIKIIYGHKRYIVQNIASANSLVRQELDQRYTYITILESLLIQSSNIHTSTSFKETLSVIDNKQFMQHSLVHISDDAFKFFMALEQLRIRTLCHNKLNVLKQDLLHMAVNGVKGDEHLKKIWLETLAAVEGLEKEKLIILGAVVDKFFKMGAGQYIRDFRRDFNVNKTEAHRKRVQEKKIIKERVADKISLQSMKDDMSEKKQDSHNLLVALVTKRPNIFETTTYNKREIKTIYEAYGQRFVASWNKVKLNGFIVEHIKVAESFAQPDVFDNC